MCELNYLRCLVNEQHVAAGKEILVVLNQTETPCGAEEVKVFVEERLAAAAGQIFVGVERVMREYKEDITRYRLLDVALKPYINLHRADSKQLLVCKEEWSPSLDQEEEELPHIKVEQEELWTSQEGEQLQGLNETDIKVTNIVSIKSESDYKETPSPQPVSSDQREDRDDDGKEPGLNTLKTKRRRKKGSTSVTAGEDRSLHSSVVSQPIATSSKHNRARSHCCQECGRSFCRLENLKRHQRVHIGEKPYHCQQCGKIFIQLSTLQRHQRVHTGEKPYYCQQCDKSFSQSSVFYQHQHVHTGDKPYHCQQCGKSFNGMAKFRIHIRVHTGEKPYHCQQCGKSFSLLGNLKTHHHIHTGEKPFHCHQCGKSFRELSKLNRHQHVHTGDKPYHCQQCGRSFSQSGNIKRHKCFHAGKDI